MVMRIRQIDDHTQYMYNLSEMKNKILPICLQVNYKDSLGELSITSWHVVGREG